MAQGTEAVDAATVRGVNELTARWARLAVREDGPGTVFTAAGLWPLLAGLAAGGDEPVRRELAGVLGVDPQAAAGLAGRLLQLLDGTEGVDAALGLWARREVEPEQEWVDALPYGTHGELTGDPARDRALLDRWAAENTEGWIPSMPVQWEPELLLVLAAALVVRTRWVREFTPRAPSAHASGPWARRGVAELVRSGPDLGELAVADTPAGAVTRLTVQGDTGVDVQLLLGAPDMEPGAVLAAGVTMPDEAAWIVPGDRLPFGEPGPGVRVEETTSFDGRPVLSSRVPPFTVSAEHDLLADAAEFGLATACRRDDEGGHFPGVSKRVPLAVGSARQSVTAGFTAEGFFAAAVTAVGMVRAAGMPQQRAKAVRVRFDRPFGFVAVHRATGLVLTAGWVTEPDGPDEGTADQPPLSVPA